MKLEMHKVDFVQTQMKTRQRCPGPLSLKVEMQCQSLNVRFFAYFLNIS